MFNKFYIVASKWRLIFCTYKTRYKGPIFSVFIYFALFFEHDNFFYYSIKIYLNFQYGRYLIYTKTRKIQTTSTIANLIHLEILAEISDSYHNT